MRHLNLHEYQSKQLMSESGIAVQKFQVFDSADQGAAAAKALGDVPEYVLKAQVHAGGRGKGSFDSGLKGGVHLTTDPDVVQQLAKDMLGYRLHTKQTPPEGVVVNKLMVAEALDIARETYFAILMDRAFGGPVMVASPDGGVDIEAVAEKTPDRIFKEPIDITKGVSKDQTDRLAAAMGFEGEKAEQASAQMAKLYDLFMKVDATQVEINPFAETPDGRVVCFDAKINFDDNAEFRQKAIFAERDVAEEDPREVEAQRHNLNFVAMDGNIGCLVNGAGLAMATMDIIQLYGASPANFLDLGGGVQEEGVFQAFKLLTGDPKVEGLMVNIFGGIVDCSIVARGIISAAKKVDLQIPLVVRLAGTNSDEANKLLQESGLPITTATDMDDCAKKVIAALA